ncbi:hypothetical protein P0Y43_18500 [Pseudomonas entomophila]|nr:hypothetical protein [Pseudomonas entomophila]MDF0732681.1 hypothetical protein [Pseudomonas entomophila]
MEYKEFCLLGKSHDPSAWDQKVFSEGLVGVLNNDQNIGLF